MSEEKKIYLDGEGTEWILTDEFKEELTNDVLGKKIVKIVKLEKEVFLILDDGKYLAIDSNYWGGELGIDLGIGNVDDNPDFLNYL